MRIRAPLGKTFCQDFAARLNLTRAKRMALFGAHFLIAFGALKTGAISGTTF
jgi:hypothetical protein